MIVPGKHSVAEFAGLAYAGIGFVLTHVIFGLVILFLLGWVSWPNVDGEPALGPALSALIDVALIALFGLQHTGMARAAIKRISAGLLPAPLERATYVHFANVVLLLLVLLWQPIDVTIWNVDGIVPRVLILFVFALGWALSFAGSILIDHFQLLGIRQAWSWFNRAPYMVKPFQRHWLYEYVRHPIMVGLIVAFFATPHMTVGHALFAVGLTIYIVIGSAFEEKDLVAAFGASYADYRARVPGFVPRTWPGNRR